MHSEERQAEAALQEASERREAAGDRPTTDDLKYAEPGTQGGGPAPAPEAETDRLAAEFEAAQEVLQAAIQASEDPANDEAVREAAEKTGEAQKALQEAHTVAWESLSIDEKLNALAQAVGELGNRQSQLLQVQEQQAGKLLTFGQTLMRILVKAGEIDEPSGSGIVVPRMDVPRPR